MTLLVWFLLSRVGVFVVDRLVDFCVRQCGSQRVSPHTYVLTKQDKLCLFINGWIESCFLLKMYEFCQTLPRWSVLSFVNLWVLFFLDDFIYTGFHKMLHIPRLYPWIHKRHHAIAEPYGGYLHAAMEHPMEMFGGLIIHGFVLYMLQSYLDRLSVALHLFAKSCLAIANHSSKHVRLFGYDNRHHFEHHKYRNVHYAQHMSLCDTLWSRCF